MSKFVESVNVSAQCRTHSTHHPNHFFCFILFFQEGNVELYAESIANRGLSAVAQAESLKFKLLGGLAVRRACYGVMRYIMEAGAQGCELFVSGKARVSARRP